MGLAKTTIASFTNALERFVGRWDTEVKIIDPDKGEMFVESMRNEHGVLKLYLKRVE